MLKESAGLRRRYLRAKQEGRCMWCSRRKCGNGTGQEHKTEQESRYTPQSVLHKSNYCCPLMKHLASLFGASKLGGPNSTDVPSRLVLAKSVSRLPAQIAVEAEIELAEAAEALRCRRSRTVEL